MSANTVRHRSAWTVADQAVSSSQSLAVGLAVTHSVALAGVGAFAIAFAGYQIVMVVNRPLNGDSLTVGFSSASPRTRRRAFASASGGGLLLGLLVGVVVCAVGVSLQSPTGGVLVAFGIGVPAFLVQDIWRCAFFSQGRPGRALANDALVLGAMVPAFFVAHRMSPGNPAAIIGAWDAATLLGVVAGVAQVGVLPKLSAGLGWWRSTVHFGGRVLGDNLIANFAYSVGVATIAAIAGTRDLGRLRTAQVAAGIATPFILAVALIVLADGSRLLERNPARFPRVVTLGALSTVVTGLAAAIFWYFLPVHLGQVLIGHNWNTSRPLIIGAAAYVAMAGATTTLSSGLRAMRLPAVSLQVRAVAGPLTLLGAIGGAHLSGAAGAIAGIAIAEGLCAIAMAVRFGAIWKKGTWRTQAPVFRDPPAL